MTIKARSFEPLTGPIFVVTIHPVMVAQGVFKTVKAARKFADRIGGEVRIGRFVNNDIEAELTWTESGRAEEQLEINSRDRMHAARERIENRRAPGW